MLYGVFILIVLGFILNTIFKAYAFKGISVKRNISRKLLEIDEDFEVELVVENRKAIPITFLQLEERFDSSFEHRNKSKNIIKGSSELYHRAVMMAMPWQRVKRTYSFYPTKRGVYFFHDIKITIGDLLGFGSDSRSITSFQEVVVLPKRYDIENNLVPQGDVNGNKSIKRWIMEDPILTIGIREYTGLEPQKNIHWPSSLKSGKLMVKNFDYTTDNRAMIMLNIETYKPYWLNIDGERIEKCISITRSMAESLEREGIPYGLLTNAHTGHESGETNITYPGLGETHLYHILEGLGRMNYAISCSFEAYLENVIYHQGRYETYIVITPEIFDEYIDYLNILRKKCEMLVIITLTDKNIEGLDEGIQCFVEGVDKG